MVKDTCLFPLLLLKSHVLQDAEGFCISQHLNNNDRKQAINKKIHQTISKDSTHRYERMIARITKIGSMVKKL
jgi:hypothetical protein